MKAQKPWHSPGKWYVSPTYWEKEVASRRPLRPASVKFVDCTLREGEDTPG